MMDQMMGKMMPEGESADGFKICIKVDAQGAISVGLGGSMGESDDSMGAGMMAKGEMMGEGSDSGFQPVGSIKEALSAALALYKSNGQQNSPADDEQAGFQSAMGMQ